MRADVCLPARSRRMPTAVTAHVDDSTNYQVYNNTESGERTNLAVKETDGKIV
ncbi:MAG: hypothetical protein ACLURV_02860 [Gallintestinimicrobium sp.]